MTTLLADAKLGVMVVDSSITDDDRIWPGKKVFRIKGSLIGFAGDYEEGMQFLKWFKGGCLIEEKPRFKETDALVLCDKGLIFFTFQTLEPRKVDGGIYSIGTGGKAAICAYEALGFTDPTKAVRIVCKHDAGSRPPIRTYKL